MNCNCENHIHTWNCTLRTIFMDFIPGENFHGAFIPGTADSLGWL